MKPCIICRKAKPLTEFYAHPEMADGHVNKCKTCYRDAVKKNRLRRIDHYEAYERMRGSDRNRKAGRTDFYNKKSPKEHAAVMHSLCRAVSMGLIIRPKSCQNCGKVPGQDTGAGRIVEAHHRDYNKPFEVLWLCRSCHRREHAEGPKPIPLATKTETSTEA